jgi:hypothetical protein
MSIQFGKRSAIHSKCSQCPWLCCACASAERPSGKACS